MLRFEVNKSENFGSDFVLKARGGLDVSFGCIGIALAVCCLVMIKLIMVCDWHKTDPKLNVYGYILT